MYTDRSRPWPSTLSRRKALGAAVGGLAAGLAGMKGSAAQESTPIVAEETDTGERIFTMFVQTAQAGGFQPKPGEEDIYQVVLRGATAQTVYFSDRPHRIVGSVSTADFLTGLGFSEENPPNAAIVAQTADGGEDVIVVELLHPVWDAGSQTLTYDVIVLDEYVGDGFGELVQQADPHLPETFGHTSLFIDDCPDVTQCWSARYGTVGPIPQSPISMCWDPFKYGNVLCSPCDAAYTRESLGHLCQIQYPDKCYRQGGSSWECTGV
jgi:hypothetical protein